LSCGSQRTKKHKQESNFQIQGTISHPKLLLYSGVNPMISVVGNYTPQRK
jgi:hypothetical protein